MDRDEFIKLLMMMPEGSEIWANDRDGDPILPSCIFIDEDGDYIIGGEYDKSRIDYTLAFEKWSTL